MKAGTAFDQVGDASGHPNAVCYDVENENYYENGNNNNNNNNNNNDGSGGVSSTMGCSADGSFVVAQFSGGTCDGNYFLKTTDRLSDYNKAMNGVNCRQIWNYRKHYSGSSSSSNNNGAQRELNNNDDANSKSSYSYANPAEALLSNSWACDISVYPKGCPDPYGLKKRYDAVLQAVSSGRSSRMAVTNARLKVPLTVVSWVAVSVGIGFLFAAYFISNKLRIEKTGLLPTLCHDFKKASISCCKHSWTKFALYCTGFWTYASGAARRQRKMRRNQRREQKLKEKQSKMEEKKSRKLRRQMGSSGGTDTLQNSDSLGSPTSEDSQSPNRSSRRAISTGRASTRRGLISQTRRSSTSTGRSKSTSRRMSKLRKEQVDGAPIEQNLHRYPSGRKSWTEVSVDTSEN